MANTSLYSVLVDGQDVTARFHPLLLTLTVKIDDKGTSDSADFELDDTGGQIALPRVGASVVVMLGDADKGVAEVFTGTVDKPHSAGSRSKGRTLTLSAKSADMTSKIKEKAQRHKDDATLGDVAQEWGGKAGLQVKIDSSLSNIHRPYWQMGNESFMAWGLRTAREIGATFKVYGKTAIMVPRTGGASVSGAPLLPVYVTWGAGLHEWSATPEDARPQYGEFQARYYDVVAAEWKVATSGASGPGTAIHMHPKKMPDKDQAQRQADANKAEGDREKGGADSVTISGDVTAQPGAPCILSGIRPGIDGTYLISSVTHTLSRGKGFTTQLGLKQPTGAAGTDDRE